MSRDSISYTCTALLGTNKKGILKPDADGYYEITVGGFNVKNHGGVEWPLGEAAKLFAPGSVLRRRLDAGVVNAEYGHPRRENMDATGYFKRLNEIHEDKMCGHFKELRLDYTSYKSKEGFPVVAVIGKIRPKGPFGKCLKDSLDNPNEEVCFSIRAGIDVIDGRNYVQDIVTYDYVAEGGISFARKYYSAGLESLGAGVIGAPLEDNLIVTPAMLDIACKTAVQFMGLESADASRLLALRDRLGWTQRQSGIHIPSYL